VEGLVTSPIGVTTGARERDAAGSPVVSGDHERRRGARRSAPRPLAARRGWGAGARMPADRRVLGKAGLARMPTLRATSHRRWAVARLRAHRGRGVPDGLPWFAGIPRPRRARVPAERYIIEQAVR